jgi:hypothetical protein
VAPCSLPSRSHEGERLRASVRHALQTEPRLESSPQQHQTPIDARRSCSEHVSKTTQQPFEVELPILLEARGMTLRGLARDVGIDPTFLSRVVRHNRGKVPNVSLIERVAVALGLSPEYFVEIRVARVVDAMEADPELREKFFRAVDRLGK